MKRLLPLLVFLLLIVLILFFWQKQISKNKADKNNLDNINVEKSIDDINSEKEIVNKDKKIKFRPSKREVRVPLEKLDLEIEVKSDENGVIITKIGDKEVEKRVSSLPVQRLSVKNGIMTFWEVNEKTQKLKYRSINLSAYVERIEE